MPRPKPTILPYKIDPETGCWNWSGCRYRNGYGMTRYRGKCAYAHRVFWELANGPIPDGLVIDHVVCSNRLCCNPDHMRVCTNTENIRRRPTIRLSVEKAAAIRASDEPRRILAERYGVSVRTIQKVRAGETWR